LSNDINKENKIKEDYPQIERKVNVLYAPTFRKNAGVEIEALVENFDFEKFNLVLKKHWLDKTDYSQVKKKGVIVDSQFSSIDWMKVCSKVITDYSAISLEAAIMDKELYLYLADEEEYEDKVGLNIDFRNEAIKDYVCTDAISLCGSIEKPYDMVSVLGFKNKYITVEQKDCTGRLASFIESLF